VLAVFCAGNGLNEMMQLTFSPVFAATEAAFGVSASAVTALPTLYLAAFAPAALALALLRTRWGLRPCLLAGACVQAAGAWLRYGACAAAPSTPPAAFAALAAGQLIAALAQPVYTNLPAALSSVWFPAQTRALATVAATLANPVGNALGSALPGLLVPAGATPEQAAAALARIALAQAVAATVIAAATWALLDEAPAEPPSAAAALRRKAAAAAVESDAAALVDAADASESLLRAAPAPLQQRPSSAAPRPGAWALLLHDLSALLRDGNFLLLLAGFGLGLGVFNALLSLLGQLLAPCGYSAATAGLAGGAMLGSGLLTAVSAGVVLRMTGALYLVPALRAGIAAAAAAMVCFLLALRPGGEAMLLVASAALGAAAVPLLPLALENAAEQSFPVAEDSSAFLLVAAGKLVGVVFVAGLQPLVSASACTTAATPAAGVIAAAIAAAAALLLSFRADYRRSAAEGDAAATSSLLS
jgi:hypothetical protein